MRFCRLRDVDLVNARLKEIQTFESSIKNIHVSVLYSVVQTNAWRDVCWKFITIRLMYSKKPVKRLIVPKTVRRASLCELDWTHEIFHHEKGVTA